MTERSLLGVLRPLEGGAGRNTDKRGGGLRVAGLQHEKPLREALELFRAVGLQRPASSESAAMPAVEVGALHAPTAGVLRGPARQSRVEVRSLPDHRLFCLSGVRQHLQNPLRQLSARWR